MEFEVQKDFELSEMMHQSTQSFHSRLSMIKIINDF